jgi:glutamate carboxypeptidase
VLQRKGTGSYRIITHGKAAHAGVEPEKGYNAVVEMAHQILKVSTFGNSELGTTVNVNVVSGGTKTNVIPDYATASVDVRVAEISEAKRIEGLFRQLPNQTTVEGVTVEVKGGLNRPPMVPSQETLRLWEKITAIGRDLGINMKWRATGGGSDGNFTATLGIPTIDALGPTGGNAHSEDEYLELNSIIPTVQLICNVCTALADGRLR